MPRQITLADGRAVEVECLSCALTSGLIAPTGGVIYESSLFHVHQDVAYPIRGLVILASKRHFIMRTQPITFIYGWFQDMNGWFHLESR
jgi:hypothetical protein